MNAENLVLVVQRKLKASPERLFDAWTKAEFLAQWFCCAGKVNQSTDADPQVGGAWQITMRAEDTGKLATNNGKYLVLDRPNKIVFTWHPLADPGYETKVTVLFKKLSEGLTEMVLSHEGLRNEEDFKGHSMGWDLVTGNLNTWLGK
jgi:uncharacterized protein YndB with AHSA1/START domain